MRHRFRNTFNVTFCPAVACIERFVATVASAVGDFLRAVEGLPPAPGLSEDVSGGLAFDAAGGCIVEAYVHGEVRDDQVRRFYRETLPQLGWIAECHGQFHSNGEQLGLSVTRGADGLTVHYSLSPQWVSAAAR